MPNATTTASTTSTSPWQSYLWRVLAAELRPLTRYATRVVQWRPRPSDAGGLLKAIDTQERVVVSDSSSSFAADGRTMVLLDGTLNHEYDIQAHLSDLRRNLTRSSRVVAILYNPYLRLLYQLANRFGIRHGECPVTFLTRTDLQTVATLAGYRVVRLRPVGYCPWRLGGLGDLLNAVMPLIPIVRWLAFMNIAVLRPVMPEQRPPSISIVVPARNEKGNIEGAVTRLPDFNGAARELIFVEGHSSDGTWEEIERVREKYGDMFPIRAIKQTGRGKSDAVRAGFAIASNELLTILDADLTMPPENLPQFYEAYCAGHADFVNGNRLTYPMEGQAMQFLNWLGNIFFAKALSFVLDVRIGDSLCGTKLMTRADYERFVAWRKDFGEFDPFGDFELLFPAAELGLGIIDLPVRYRDRVYGSTNIRRFYHGWMLLKMTAIGLVRVKVGRFN